MQDRKSRRTSVSTAVAALSALIVSLLFATGCATTTVVKTAANPQSSGHSAVARREVLSVGGTATLVGQQSGERLEATLLAYKPSVSAGEYDTPQSGMKFVGVTLKLKNVGTIPYSDSPSNGATIITANGQQGKTALISSGECGEDFASNVKLAPEEDQQGCIPFEIPNEASAAKFQWTPSSGFADETAEWSLSSSSATTTGGGSGHPGQEEANGASNQCDSNVAAGPGTTCPFAENVFKAYAEAYKGKGRQADTTVEASSPVTGKTYSMTCTANSHVIACKGGNSALVTFPLHAAEVY
jgi:hypothetical protein